MIARPPCFSMSIKFDEFIDSVYIKFFIKSIYQNNVIFDVYGGLRLSFSAKHCQNVKSKGTGQ